MIQAPEPKDGCTFKQPDKCMACVWGRWEASRQFCMLPVCVKETVEETDGCERG
ncbi:hypothetical protein [Paenibacillus oceani]|uniref:Uncharacterized protein n=1 Tax=Paenibacillus oceani TaxID=2772510 RepID=A0A927C5T7_9BACL|nr:hypothetical protein [Paenibacillus oceani]MBD2860542.1 hypothetical protein [Paenibacillus oceani]